MTAIASLFDLLPNATQAWAEVSDAWKQRIAEALADGITPQVFVQPETEAELAIALTHAHKNDLSVLTCGNGSKLTWGNLVQGADLVLSTAKLNHLIENAAGDLTFTAEAGMTLAQAQAILKPHNLFLAIDPSYPNSATLGGVVATADTGSLRHRYGGIRDMLLGIQFVRADGQIAKAGGRVVKNVAGYDLMKLFTGSYGTLGLLTQVTLRAFPIPEARRSVTIVGEQAQLERVAGAIDRSSLSPISMDWVWAQGALSLTLCFATVEASVTEQTEEVIALALACGCQSHVSSESGLPDVRQERPLAKFGALPAKAGLVLAEVQQQMQEATVILHANSGLGKVYGPQKEGAQLESLRNQCTHCDGFLSLLEVSRMLKNEMEVWGYSNQGLSIMKSIRQHFDPKENINIGRFVTG